MRFYLANKYKNYPLLPFSKITKSLYSMKKRISRKGIKIYLFIILIGILFSPSFSSSCLAQAKVNASDYAMYIQQADQALAAKDYANAILLYEKASRTKPELMYAPGKMSEISAALEKDPNKRAEIFEDIMLKAETLYKQKKYPEAKVEFHKAILIDPALQFPKDRLVKISAVYTDPDDLAYFNDAVANGDKMLAANEFDKAIVSYENALTVKPDSKVVKDKITNTRKQQADFKTRSDQSAKSIAAADKLLQNGKRTEARAEYQKAIDLMPGNQRASQKIQEIDNYTNNKKAIQDSYDKSIEQADQFYISRDFASASLKYQEALKAMPEARYPKDMLEKTKSGESALQSDQQKFDAVLLSAENLLKSSDYDAALAGFKSASSIKPAEAYPKTKIAEIEKLIAENSSRKEKFDLAIKNGDQSLQDKKYDEALNFYQNALSLLPGEKYPSQKITEITAITAQQKTLDENYKKSITEADKQFTQGKFAEAITAYNQALVYKPNETYPQQKLTEVQNQLDAFKSKESSYASAIINGDKLVTESKYTEALDAYKQALVFKPAEKYPKDKSDEIIKILAKQKSDSDSYTLLLANGEKALASGNYTLALNSFREASGIKPTEQYPKDKISEINSTIAARQKTDEQYKTVVNTGDQLFATKEYDRAKAAYSEATDLKKNEKYPQDQLAKINKILGDLRSVEENYSQAVAEGDKNFTTQKYTEAITSYKRASGFKPAEAYPKSQLDKINILLAEQKKLDSDYNSSITSADKLFTTKKYDEAIVAYRQSLIFKPSEKYPTEKIAETEKLLNEQKSVQESYEKAVAEGDKLLTIKDYLNALASFRSASSVKPGETYPKLKMTEIQAILDKDKAEGQRYQEAIAQADKSFSDKKYSEALTQYQNALKIKSAEKYPIDQVVKINQLIADQKKIDEDYQKLITDADVQLKLAKYIEARGIYSDAGTLKPAEKLPKDKIAEIDGILTGIKQSDQNFQKAIAEGDAFFAEKKYPEAITSYSKAATIKAAESYPKSQIDKINSLVAEQKKLDDNFLVSLTSADKFFEAKKYAEAIFDYRKALVLKPTENYPAEKIAEAEKQLADLKTRQETYDKAIADGDKKLLTKDYENALIAFRNAGAAKPAELFPTQKIAEIQSILDKIKGENDRYMSAIDVADKFFKVQKYREALEPYQTAGTIKPTEKYPQEQIALINQKLAGQKKIDDDYQQLITDASTQFTSGKYDDARISYTKAALLKPIEKLPKDKIAEIDGMLASIKLKEENYTKAISSASEMYASKNLNGAIKSYEEALRIKPAEKYPQERIAAIKSEIKAKDDSYANAIAFGDSKMVSKNLMEALNAYQSALEIKPDEEYPKSKIAGINSALKAQKEDLEKMYRSYISEGDQLAGTKDYAGAKTAFTKATGIKPTETYPKQRLSEISKIVEEIELARRAEYNKALGEADKLYNTKIFDLAIDAYETASLINPGDSYPTQQISKIRMYMSEHAIKDLYSQTLLISEGNEKKFDFPAIELRQRKNNYILLKARTTGKSAPKVYLNYGKDGQKNGGIVLRSIDKTSINDYLIRISVQDKWYREDNNWISLFVETGDIEITRVQIAAGDE